MKWVLYVLGVIFAAVGAVWILQGTNVLRGGMMGGHIIYAVLGVVVLVIGILLFALGSRRRRTAS